MNGKCSVDMEDDFLKLTDPAFFPGMIAADRKAIRKRATTIVITKNNVY